METFISVWKFIFRREFLYDFLVSVQLNACTEIFLTVEKRKNETKKLEIYYCGNDRDLCGNIGNTADPFSIRGFLSAGTAAACKRCE